MSTEFQRPMFNDHYILCVIIVITNIIIDKYHNIYNKILKQCYTNWQLFFCHFVSYALILFIPIEGMPYNLLIMVNIIIIINIKL